MNTCSVLDVFYVQHGACVPSGIYRIINVKDGKIYIGQGADVLSRWRQHRHALSKGNHTNRKLQSAWNYHGPDSFVFELVKECTSEVIGDEEIAALAEVPKELQYNLGAAGYNPTIGIVKTEESRLTVSRAGGGRPFFAKNLTTGEVRRFEHAGEVDAVGFRRSHVYSCLAGNRPTHIGHKFFYDESFVPEKKEPKAVTPREKRNREVIGTNIDTGEEIRFPYIAKVKDGGFKRTGVAKVLSGIMDTHRGYRWRYADGKPHVRMDEAGKEKLRGFRKHGRSQAVVGVDEHGKERHFAYIEEAAKAVGVTAASLHHYFNKGGQTCAGMKWRRAEAPKDQEKALP